MTDRQTDASDLIICPMLCNSNGTDNNNVMCSGAYRYWSERRSLTGF